MQKYAVIALTALLSATAVSAANANACAKDPYKALLPLSKYSAAESFCSSKYPLSTVTSTSTVTVTAGAQHKRGGPTPTTTKATTTPAKTTTTACTGACSTWTSASKQGGGFLSTLCSCIETQQTTTVTKTLTVSTTTTTASTAPTVTCPSGDIKDGPPRCNCYYHADCHNRYVGTVNASTTVSSYEDCITFAGNIDTGYYRGASLNYFPGSGLCQALVDPPASASDPTAIAANAVVNAENCYYHNIEDLNRNGCGCSYAEDCDMYYDGTELQVLPGAGIATCQESCDYAGTSCVGFSIDGGQKCTLYSSITAKSRTFGITSYYRDSCPNACVKS